MRFLKTISVVLSTLVVAAPAIAQDTSSSTHDHQHGSGMHGDMRSMQGKSAASKAAADHQFLDTMSMHHEHGIKMAELVESRTAHDELKTLAKKMIDEQRKDIQQMQDMKQKLYAGKPDAANMGMPGMKESMKGMETKMEKLEASKGEAFDRMFLDMMTKHHQDALKMTRSLSPKFQHQEVKDMAKKMSDSQREDIAKMTKWKKEWKLATK